VRQTNLYAAKARLSELVQAALDAAFCEQAERQVAALLGDGSL
jgi:hypothetical protein